MACCIFLVSFEFEALHMVILLFSFSHNSPRKGGEWDKTDEETVMAQKREEFGLVPQAVTKN